MAKNAFPMTGTGGGKKFIGFVVVVALLVLVVKDPHGAAGMASGLWNTGSHVIDAIATFFRSFSA